MLSPADVAEINEFLGCTATAGTRWDEGRQQYECMDMGEWFDTWTAAWDHFTPEWLFQYQLEAPSPSSDTEPGGAGASASSWRQVGARLWGEARSRSEALEARAIARW